MVTSAPFPATGSTCPGTEYTMRPWMLPGPGGVGSVRSRVQPSTARRAAAAEPRQLAMCIGGPPMLEASSVGAPLCKSGQPKVAPSCCLERQLLAEVLDGRRQSFGESHARLPSEQRARPGDVGTAPLRIVLWQRPLRANRAPL